MKNTYLRGKWALLTGATGALGRQIATGLALVGMNIIIHYNASEKSALEISAQIKSLGRESVILKADLSKVQEAENVIANALELSGRIDFIVNAASGYKKSSLDNISMNDLTEALTLNTFSPFIISRTFRDACRSGAIVNILDARMVDFDKTHVAYSLSKQMLFSLTRMMSREFAPEIRVNAVAPGIITLPENTPSELIAKMKKATFLNKTGSPDEITEAIIYLLSNTFVTGETLFVDGGRNMRGKMFGL